MMNTIVLSHVLERVRPQWLLHAQLQRICGLAFLE